MLIHIESQETTQSFDLRLIAEKLTEAIAKPGDSRPTAQPTADFLIDRIKEIVEERDHFAEVAVRAETKIESATRLLAESMRCSFDVAEATIRDHASLSLNSSPEENE